VTAPELDGRQIHQLHAGIRVNDVPDGLPFDTSAEALRGQKMLNLRKPTATWT